MITTTITIIAFAQYGVIIGSKVQSLKISEIEVPAFPISTKKPKHHHLFEDLTTFLETTFLDTFPSIVINHRSERIAREI